MSIASILRGKGGGVETVAPDTNIHVIVERLHARRIGAVLVTQDERVVGVVSERDVVRCLHEKGASVLDSSAADIMTSPVHSVSPQHSISEALSLMSERRIRHLPVIEAGRLVGLVSIGDLVKRRIEDAEAEAGALQDYIRTA